MRRGEIWTASGGQDYASKPRPAVIVQEDAFDWTESITICGFTTLEVDAPLARLPIVPDMQNGLRERCWLMADKVMTVSKTKLGKPIGRLSDADMLRLNRALLVFLGLAGSSRR